MALDAQDRLDIRQNPHCHQEPQRITCHHREDRASSHERAGEAKLHISSRRLCPSRTRRLLADRCLSTSSSTQKKEIGYWNGRIRKFSIRTECRPDDLHPWSTSRRAPKVQ